MPSKWGMDLEREGSWLGTLFNSRIGAMRFLGR